MKPEIHPAYKEIKVACSCGNTFVTGSTIGHDLHIEICAKCHPFYTGTQKLIDTAGRVDRFRQKYGQSSKAKVSATEGQAKAGAAEGHAKAAEGQTTAGEAKVKASAGEGKAKANASEPKAKAKPKAAARSGESKAKDE